ncbi:MAG: hypothetical protein RLY58_2086 [Pseudomonadota bacterium]|jgi:hypothetical protein
MTALAARQPLIVEGQPRYGRLDSPPAAINLHDFQHRTPYGKPLPAWRRRLAFKQFQFVSLNHQHWMVGLALVDLGWAGHGFFYIHDRNTGQTFEKSITTPLGLGARLDLTPQQGCSRFEAGDLRLRIDQSVTGRAVRVEWCDEVLLSAWLDETAVQPLCLASPTGATGWTYTQKSTTLPVSGWLTWQGQRVDLSQGDWLAGTDDSCGVLRHETAWHWLSLSTTLPDGVRLGINLAMGVNDGFGTENTLWVDGQAQALPPVLFRALGDHTWQITSADGAVQLQVVTGWRRHESVNAGLVGSHFSQWVAEVSGSVQTPSGQVLSVYAQLGLLEQHYARW